VTDDPPTKRAEIPICSSLDTFVGLERKLSESIRAKHKVPCFLISEEM
jgi:hypothetical protein